MRANALLLLIGVGIGLFIVEAGLRFTHYRYLTHPNVRYPPGYFEEDPKLGIDLAPDRPPAPVVFEGPTFEAFTNGLGCFDHDAPIGQDWVLAIGEAGRGAHGAEFVLIANGLPERGWHGRLRGILASELPHYHGVAASIEQAAQGRIRYHHDRHWNALGNRLAAEAIYRYLIDAGLLRPSGG